MGERERKRVRGRERKRERESERKREGGKEREGERKGGGLYQDLLEGYIVIIISLLSTVQRCVFKMCVRSMLHPHVVIGEDTTEGRLPVCVCVTLKPTGG